MVARSEGLVLFAREEWAASNLITEHQLYRPKPHQLGSAQFDLGSAKVSDSAVSQIEIARKISISFWKPFLYSNLVVV